MAQIAIESIVQKTFKGANGFISQAFLQTESWGKSFEW